MCVRACVRARVVCVVCECGVCVCVCVCLVRVCGVYDEQNVKK